MAFVLPLVEKLKLIGKKSGRPPMVLVMAPTRELAKQVGFMLTYIENTNQNKNKRLRLISCLRIKVTQAKPSSLKSYKFLLVIIAGLSHYVV